MGFFDKYAEVVDFKVTTLLTPGNADDEARKWTKFYSGGDIKTFMQLYRVQWQRQYKHSFSVNRLARDGYLPATANGILLTPIIPLKIKDVLVQQDQRKLIRIMKKLNISGDEFWTQLQYECNGYTPPKDDPNTPANEGPKDDPSTPNEDEGNPAWCPVAYRKKSPIDNAYIFIGLYPGIEDNMGAAGGLYETFMLMSAKGNSFALSLNEVYGNYKWDSVVTTHSGKLQVKHKNGTMVDAKVGEYKAVRSAVTTTSKTSYTRPAYDATWNQITCESNGYFFCSIEQKCLNSAISDGANGVIGGTGGVMTYSKQISLTQYKSIKISNYEQEWVVIRNGVHHKKTFGIVTGEDEGEEGARVLIPLEVWNDLKFKYWIGTYEYGLSMLIFAHDRQKLKWYQRGIFKVIMFIVMIVVNVIVPGSGAIMKAVVDAVINAVIAMAIGTIISSLSPELALIVGIVMMIWGAGGGMNFDVSKLMSFDNFLPMVDKSIAAYNELEEIQIKSAIEASEEELEKLEEENDAMVELMGEVQGPQLNLIRGNIDMNISGSSPGGQINPDEYFYQKYGNHIYDFDLLYDVDYSIDVRKDVKVG